jgi:hypothetical protein
MESCCKTYHIAIAFKSRFEEILIKGRNKSRYFGRSKIPFCGTNFLPTIIDGQWKKRYRKFCRLHIEKGIPFECLSSLPFIIPPDDRHSSLPASSLSLKNDQLVQKYSRRNKNQSVEVG